MTASPAFVRGEPTGTSWTDSANQTNRRRVLLRKHVIGGFVESHAVTFAIDVCPLRGGTFARVEFRYGSSAEVEHRRSHCYASGH